ncbi:MAG TPA: alpha/beta hydrolase [Chthonomonadaceae bacterium]|nr:alpha/beta hydrolase [Chthonomonadaceae bacterium]
MHAALLSALLVVATTCAASATFAEPPVVLDLWPGKVPGDTGIGPNGPIGPERVRDPADAPTSTAKWLTNVTRPTLTIYRPPADRNTGTAFIVCPGGGYWNLAWDLEGTEVAEWLRAHGITGIVLKYRCPRRAGEQPKDPAPGPLLDAQRAVSLVRSRAKDWGIDPKRIGIGGFSAGGHLALSTGIHYEKRAYDLVDAIDAASCRPDFAVAAYPGYLADKDTWELLPAIRIPRGMPPVMLVHAFGDTEPGSSSIQSAEMFLALKRAGVPTELHIYAAGDHGFGIRKSDKPVSTWGNRCLDWLRNLGMYAPRN